MPTIREIIAAIEAECPLALQEQWDNSGLQVGDPDLACTGALLAVEATEETVREAADLGYNLLITHHPILFHPLRQISTLSYVERTVALAIRRGVAIYASHTAADNTLSAMNGTLAQRLQLQKLRPLAPARELLYSLSVMVPPESADTLKKALFAAGAGKQGNYEDCCFCSEGRGQFRAAEGAAPYIGEIGKTCYTSEMKISFRVEAEKLSTVLRALKDTHPYEEPAYDILAVANQRTDAGSGLIGELIHPCQEMELLQTIAAWPQVENVAYSHLQNRKASRIAICSGSGGSFLKEAVATGCDLLLTGEAKYNHFLDAAGYGILLVSIGHYESETVARDIFARYISARFPNFAVGKSHSDINPVNYLR